MNAPPNDNSGQPRPNQPAQPQRDIYGNPYDPSQLKGQSAKQQDEQPQRDMYGNVYDQAYVQSPERPASAPAEYGTGYGAQQPAKTFDPYSPSSSSDPQTPLPPTGFYGPERPGQEAYRGQEASALPGQQGYTPQYGRQAYGVPYAAQYAGVGIRCIALLIDSVLIGIIGGIVESMFNNVSSSSLFAVVTMFAYFIIMEAKWGATLGKMALKLRVLGVDGAPISWQESTIRNLLRIIDGLFFYLVGAIFAWSSPMRQRLGDRLAHTVVIHRGV